jgi:hypothetical protein
MIVSLVVAAACSVERPTEESLLAAFKSEMIPKMAGVVSSEGMGSWMWTGEVRNDEGLVSPFTTQVTVTALRIEKTGTEASYAGFVSWDCTGTGPFRCFEHRYSHEETQYEYHADSRRWQKVETERPRR